MTFMPTHSPASARRVQRVNAGVSAELATTSPSAKKSIAMAISCEASPQQASEKNVELSAAASPPKTVASGDSFNCRKKNHAPMPRIHSATGATNFA